MDKLSVKQGLILAADSHIAIDLSSFYKEALAPKIELILSAAEERRLIGFDYVSPRGEGRRKIEPYVLISSGPPGTCGDFAWTGRITACSSCTA